MFLTSFPFIVCMFVLSVAADVALLSCQSELRPQIPSVNFNFCAIAFFRFPCHFLLYKKNGGQSSRRRLSRCKKFNGKLCNIAASAMGAGAGARGAAESPSSVRTEAPCPRCVSAQGGSASVANGQRKWLPKTAGRLPVVCRAEKAWRR